MRRWTFVFRCYCGSTLCPHVIGSVWSPYPVWRHVIIYVFTRLYVCVLLLLFCLLTCYLTVCAGSVLTVNLSMTTWDLFDHNKDVWKDQKFTNIDIYIYIFLYIYLLVLDLILKNWKSAHVSVRRFWIFLGNWPYPRTLTQTDAQRLLIRVANVLKRSENLQHGEQLINHDYISNLHQVYVILPINLLLPSRAL